MTFEVHPQFLKLIDNMAGSDELEKLWTYHVVEENALPPHYIFIYDRPLSQEEMDECGLEFIEAMRGYGVYTHTPDGAHYLGIGHDRETAIAHAVYQAIRSQFFASGFPFTPLITYEEILVVGEDECLPTQHIRYKSEDELSDLIDGMNIDEPVNQGYSDGWAVEIAPSQWSWGMMFTEAVERLYTLIPKNWVVH